MVELSWGQRLALDQLRDISAQSDGLLEIRGEPGPAATAGHIRLELSLDTALYRTAAGLTFRERERLVLVIAPDFPFLKPALYFSHTRFVGKPHVQWGRYICLYQSPETEYQPSDGMFGYFQRVHEWMMAAGRGELDPEDAPLHPPVAYASSSTKFVVKADTPADDTGDTYWIGRANLVKVRDDRFDLLAWTHLSDWDDDDPGHPIAAAIFVKRPLATEYPTKVYDLINLVEAAGLQFITLWRMLRLFAVMTAHNQPAWMVFGAPMRRKAEGESLRPHLTVWEIAAEPLAALRAYIRSKDEDEASKTEVFRWLATAELQWCSVMEDRPEIVHRRDRDALTSALRGKRVLLFGCGALGSAIATSVLRAGAAKLHLVDKGSVKPGVLVRQRFGDEDIGRAKTSALSEHLVKLGLSGEVTGEEFDLSVETLSHFALEEWDYLIDATASASVAHRLERDLKLQTLSIPLVSVAVSASAHYGSVAVKMPGYFGGLQHIARQAKLAAFARNSEHPMTRAFWPDRKAIKAFQPEPGCSEPTFIGSAADIDHHAAGLLNVGLSRVASLQEKSASLDLIAAPWLDEAQRPGDRLRYEFEAYVCGPERRHGYRVLRSDAAAKAMTAELRRIARTRSNKVETGGLIFGEIDDSHQEIWVDSVSGPPPDSIASANKFVCGTSGTKKLASLKSRMSGQSSKFIGIWHTHPIAQGRPSIDDLNAMVQLLHFQDHAPRQVVMLILGFAATRPVENYYLFRRNEFTILKLQELNQEGGA